MSAWYFLFFAQFFFFRVFAPKPIPVPKTAKKKKKRTRPISSHLDRTSLVNKGFILWLSRKFFLREAAGIPDRAR